MTSKKSELGAEAEELAANYIHSKGYKIIAKNWQYKGRGELDLVAWDEETLVFVEVRYRGTGSWESPQQSITPKKLHNLRKTSQLYAKIELKETVAMRIDLVGVSFSPKLSQGVQIQHFKNITG